MRQPKILVVGSMNMDVNIYGVPKIPDYGESVACRSYLYSIGGKGSNQAYAAALQGADVTMVGRVGQDDNGYILARELEKAGVNTSHIVFDQEAQTGLAPIMVDPSGKYVSYVVLGANNNLRPEDVKKAINSDYYDMVVMQLEIPLETVYKTYEFASAKGIPVFLDAGPAMKISLESLKGMYIISPNEAETKALTGITVDSEQKALEASKRLFSEAEPQFVILKMGSQGAYIYDGTKGRMYPAYKIETVDSTGAGDTFNAVLAFKLCQGMDLDEAVKHANAAAALCVSRKGALTSIPTLREVDEFLKVIDKKNNKLAAN
ncbi:ribokinase [Halalkalibacter lacteus]|uniref:ribokinase n=1 Tax=Halalkalibacter lacteus TaxID=3090663 RepID=UPI002FC8110B